MTKTELIQFAEAKGAEAKERNFDGMSSISIFINPIVDEASGIRGFQNAVFVKRIEDKWIIGFSQSAETRLLTDKEVKSIIGAWIEQPDNEILRAYEST